MSLSRLEKGILKQFSTDQLIQELQDRGADVGAPQDRARSRDSGKCEETIELEECDPAFGLRGKLVGDRGTNVHHVQDQSRAKVYVAADASNVQITAERREDLEKARQMTLDLVNSVMGEYDEWLATEQGHESYNRGERRKGKDKGKGKGDRKGKGKDKDKGKESGRERARDAAENNQFSEVLELEATEPGFRIVSKIIGDKGKNIHHIQDASRGKILVGEDGDKITISAHSESDLNSAIRMVSDLVGTIMEGYDEWLQETDGRDGGDRRSGKDGKGKSKGDHRKGKGKDRDGKDGGRAKDRHGGDGEFMDVLELEETDPEFNLHRRFLGERGKNVHHIQDQSKAKLFLEDQDGVRLHISAHRQEDLDKAVELANDLLESVMNDYTGWCEEKEGVAQDGGSRSKSHKGGKGKDKGKGKGKRKSFDSGPSAKRRRTD